MTTDNDNLMRPLYETLDRQKAEVKRLLDFLACYGWALICVSDGEGEVFFSLHDNLADMLSAAVSCDEAYLTMGHADHLRRPCLHIVHGNDPGELVADGSQPNSPIWDLIHKWSDAEQAEAQNALGTQLTATAINEAREKIRFQGHTIKASATLARADAIPHTLEICEQYELPNGVGIVTITYDGTVEAFLAAPAAIMVGTVSYGKASHNSDMMRICYRTDKQFAFANIR